MKDHSASGGAPPAGARWHCSEDLTFLSQDIVTMSADNSKTHGSVLVFVSPASSSESLGIRMDVVDGRPPPKKCDHKLSSAPSSGHKSKNQPISGGQTDPGGRGLPAASLWENSAAVSFSCRLLLT